MRKQFLDDFKKNNIFDPHVYILISHVIWDILLN